MYKLVTCLNKENKISHNFYGSFQRCYNYNAHLGCFYHIWTLKTAQLVKYQSHGQTVLKKIFEKNSWYIKCIQNLKHCFCWESTVILQVCNAGLCVCSQDAPTVPGKFNSLSKRVSTSLASDFLYKQRNAVSLKVHLITFRGKKTV